MEESIEKANGLLQECYMVFVEPLAHVMTEDLHITIVPYLELFSLPCAAPRKSTGEYLIEKHTVTVLPCLACWSQIKCNEQVCIGQRSTMIMGNPCFPASLQENGRSLPTLPGSVEEVQVV